MTHLSRAALAALLVLAFAPTAAADARTDLDKLAKEKGFFSLEELDQDAPRGVIEKVAAGDEAMRATVQTVTRTAGPVPTRVYRVQARMLATVLDRWTKGIAEGRRPLAVTALDLMEDEAGRANNAHLPGGTDERAWQGEVRVVAFGIDPAAVKSAPDAAVRAALDDVKAWLKDRNPFAETAALSITELPSDAALRGFKASRERLELKVHGGEEAAVKDLGERLARQAEVKSRWKGSGTPKVAKGYATITFEKK